MPENIAQLEFFLFKAENVKSIAREVDLRARDNKRIKLVLRLFDTGNRLTEFTRKMDVLRGQSQAFHDHLPSNIISLPWWRRWWIDRQSKRLARKSLDYAKHMLELAIEELKDTVRNEKVIALESYPGAPFRLVRHNELLELVEAANRAHGVWVFIFAPNELLADRVTLVTRAM